MLHLKNIIYINRNSYRSIYLQICDQLITLIKSGKLLPSTRLPGTRKLSEDLTLHRKTVIAAYAELEIQGWIETIPSKGTFVSKTLPIVKLEDLKFEDITKKNILHTNFNFNTNQNLSNYSEKQNSNLPKLKVNDGSPDHRLAPLDELAKVYRNLTKKNFNRDLIAYSDPKGNLTLRQELVKFLNDTRGLNCTVDNILITRGSQMGIYLASQILFDLQQTIVVGNTNYLTANNTFKLCNAKVMTVTVDKQGINTNELNALCAKAEIRAVYVTPHHHHPTTVTLSAERRMHLLELSKKYNFAIIEDDYDYDFHYDHAPILPLASNDIYGNVIYIGGFTKIIAPGLRIGYMVAPKDFIDEASKLRRIIDRQGDELLEKSIAKMISTGDIHRHINKTLKIYKERRDLFCDLLKEKLSSYFTFEIPRGGMAIWIQLNKNYSWDYIINESAQRGLELNPEWRRYDPNNLNHNGIRLGFASLNKQEIIKVISILCSIFEQTN